MEILLNSGEAIPLTSNRLTIGTENRRDIVLANSDNSDQLAQIIKVGERWMIEIIDGEGLVNGNPCRAHWLSIHDRVEIPPGEVLFTVREIETPRLHFFSLLNDHKSKTMVSATVFIGTLIAFGIFSFFNEDNTSVSQRPPQVDQVLFASPRSSSQTLEDDKNRKRINEQAGTESSVKAIPFSDSLLVWVGVGADESEFFYCNGFITSPNIVTTSGLFLSELQSDSDFHNAIFVRDSQHRKLNIENISFHASFQLEAPDLPSSLANDVGFIKLSNDSMSGLPLNRNLVNLHRDEVDSLHCIGFASSSSQGKIDDSNSVSIVQVPIKDASALFIHNRDRPIKLRTDEAISLEGGAIIAKPRDMIVGLISRTVGTTVYVIPLNRVSSTKGEIN